MRCNKRKETFFKDTSRLDTKRHDGIDNIIVVFLEGFDGLVAADVGLCHDQLDVLVLDAIGVDLLIVVVVLFLLLGVTVLGVAVAGVVVTGVLTTLSSSLGGNLLGSGGLGSGVDVLDLGLTKDTTGTFVSTSILPAQNNVAFCRRNSHVGVAVGRLVDLGVVDDEEDLLAFVRPGVPSF